MVAFIIPFLSPCLSFLLCLLTFIPGPSLCMLLVLYLLHYFWTIFSIPPSAFPIFPNICCSPSLSSSSPVAVVVPPTAFPISLAVVAPSFLFSFPNSCFPLPSPFLFPILLLCRLPLSFRVFSPSYCCPIHHLSYFLSPLFFSPSCCCPTSHFSYLP
jgi:hypothetical protein